LRNKKTAFRPFRFFPQRNPEEKKKQSFAQVIHILAVLSKHSVKPAHAMRRKSQFYLDFAFLCKHQKLSVNDQQKYVALGKLFQSLQ